MSLSFAGRIALVTGGGSGIGRAVCRTLAKDGARVVAADINQKAAEETVSMLINPGDHLALSVNVADKASVASLVRSVIEQLKAPPNLLANVAGITQDNFLLQMDEQSFMNVIDVNLKGTFLVTQAVTSALQEHEITSGSIVNIASIVSKTGNMGQCNYASSKAGVQAFTKTAALELARVGVRVNCVLPGFVDTAMVTTVPEKVLTMLLKNVPLRRLGQPEEIAEVVAFLLSDKSSYMTGASVEVTGGLAM
ncbi:(3R)-3-hydroxyacyl-CoA dehydrogenase-like isoform X1 [Panulirus ornatus]|uniref:(3R)-3-hydroxyacyl-CoA dehydrogenase-like isoform X1 n=2 Tax=Panulirus ornatus TaxID=150431 RepID=UPI003A84FF06